MIYSQSLHKISGHKKESKTYLTDGCMGSQFRILPFQQNAGTSRVVGVSRL